MAAVCQAILQNGCRIPVTGIVLGYHRKRRGTHNAIVGCVAGHTVILGHNCNFFRDAGEQLRFSGERNSHGILWRSTFRTKAPHSSVTAAQR